MVQVAHNHMNASNALPTAGCIAAHAATRDHCYCGCQDVEGKTLNGADAHVDAGIKECSVSNTLRPPSRPIPLDPTSTSCT